MDMIMIHGGHGHVLTRFFSPLTNQRSDGYGGSPRKRARFALEVLEAIREKVGDSLAIEYRLSADEFVPGVDRRGRDRVRPDDRGQDRSASCVSRQYHCA